jgi:tetratricopeptide (TPR) repeat protein
VEHAERGQEFQGRQPPVRPEDWKRAAEKYEEVVTHETRSRSYPQLSDRRISSWATATTSSTSRPSRGTPPTTPISRRPSTTTASGGPENATRRGKKSALQYLSAAYASDKLNDPVKAEPVYQEIIALEPKEPGNYMALAKLYEDAGRYDDAEAQYGKAKEAKPNDPSVLAGLAGYYNRQGDFPKTIAALEQARRARAQ